VDLNLNSPNTPTWRGAQLKNRDNLPLPLARFNMIPTHTPKFPSGLFPSGFLTKILYAFLTSPKRATCPTIPSSLSRVLARQVITAFFVFRYKAV
jgi:hypothetical protein